MKCCVLYRNASHQLSYDLYIYIYYIYRLKYIYIYIYSIYLYDFI